MNLKYFLPKIVAILTRTERYVPDIEWSHGACYTHDFFRFFEGIFGRKYGIRCESSVNADLFEDGTVQISRKFFTVEALIAHTEGLIRAYLKNKFVFNPLYANVILNILGYERKYVYGNGLIDNFGYRFAIAFDAVQGGTPHTVVNNTSLTYTLAPSGGDRICFTEVMASSARTISSVVFNSTGLTNINRSAGSQPVAAYYLVAPSTGSANMVVTIDSSSFIYCGSVSYTGASQTGQPDSNNTKNETNTSVTTSTTVVAANCWMVLGARNGDAGITSAGTGSTSRSADSGFMQVYDSGGTVGTGSQSMTITNAGSHNTTTSIVSFSPAVATVNSNFFLFFR